MISAAQVSDEFAARGVALEAQCIVIDIRWLSVPSTPYFMTNSLLMIPVVAGQAVEDLDPEIFDGREVWIDYDKNDEEATFKMQVLSRLLRTSGVKPRKCQFLDRKGHLRQLTDKGWKDMIPQAKLSM